MNVKAILTSLCIDGTGNEALKDAVVVVEEGNRYIGSEVAIDITSILNTAAGRMIFAKLHNHQQQHQQQQRAASR